MVLHFTSHFSTFLTPRFPMVISEFLLKTTTLDLKDINMTAMVSFKGTVIISLMPAIKKCYSASTDLLAFLQHLLIHLHFLIFIRLEVIPLLIPVTLHTFFC